MPAVFSACIGCAKRARLEPAPAPVLATVRVEALIREHPAYPEWQRLRQLSAPPSSPESEQKAETSPPQRNSNIKTPAKASAASSKGEHTVAGIAADARAMNEQHGRFREAQMPPRTTGTPPPVQEYVSPSQAAGDARLPQRQLASILRRETVDACRHIAVEHGIELKLPPDVPGEAADMTGSFRTWLREHWKKAEPGA